MEISNGRLSEAQRELFLNEGYLIADNVFDPDDLSPLRDELSGEIDGYTRELKAEGQIIDCHEDKDFDHRLTHIYPEADFRVQSRLHAGEVATFQSYRERRQAFENATSIPSPIKDRWTALPEVS